MTNRLHLLTRRYGLDIEATDSDELAKILGMLEEKKLGPWSAIQAASFPGGLTQVSQTHGAQRTDMQLPLGPSEPLGGSATASLDEFGGDDNAPNSPGVPTVGADDPAIRALTWRPSDNLFILTAQLPPGPNGADRAEEATMLLMMGYGSRGEEPVSGTRLMSSLRLSGLTVARMDRLLENARQSGQILISGAGKGRRYRLTETGKDRARKAAAEILAHLAPGTGAGGA